ncbi:decaprenyl-phosphate phosphoribosyltransferase [Gammaproteobacteria bacterium]
MINPNQLSPVPLVIDLDGPLIKSDLLLETVNWFIGRHPLQIFRLMRWLASGKNILQRKLAEVCEIDAAALPYNQAVIAWLREQKNQGRQLILATTGHRRLADAVARHLGLFDAVLENDDANNASEIARIRLPDNLGQNLDDGCSPVVQAAFKALRPHQWLKNLLVLVPLFAAHRYGERTSVLQALMAFVVFSMTASSVYLLNDLVDVTDDRHHPRKRFRPFAAGDLSLLHGWLAWPMLLILAFIVAGHALPMSFIGVLASYFAMTLTYSLRLKQTPILDVLILASLYTLRIIAGAAAITVPPSFWLLLFSMFIFLSLAFIKRFSEIKFYRDAGGRGLLRGRGYHHEDLDVVANLGTSAGYLAVLVLALYVQDSRTVELYRSPRFIWLACPLLLFWISRAWLIAHRGQMHDDPIVFALQDRISWLIGICFIAAFGLARMLT